MTKSLMIALAVLAASAFSALPAQAGKKSSAAGGARLPSSQVSSLTAAECNKAQGAVVTDNSCGTGAACIKEGPNGPSKMCLSFSQ